MLVGAVQIYLFGLSLLSLLAVYASALPSYTAEGQMPLVNVLKKNPEYENGELPPVENTLGWIDPRLNGGRFLDVRSCIPLAP